jgi:hypothetical protein
MKVTLIKIPMRNIQSRKPALKAISENALRCCG